MSPRSLAPDSLNTLKAARAPLEQPNRMPQRVSPRRTTRRSQLQLRFGPFAGGGTMKRRSVASAWLLVFFLTLIPTARGGRDVENDPLTRMYKNRVKHAEAQKRRIATRVEYARARYERARRLYASHAVSQEEYERTTAWYQTSVAKQDEVAAQLEEATLLLELCRSRLSEGKDMPIIPLSGTAGEELG